ncbi:MAG: hypothetical protein JRN53_07140 [Nitrososphaerota archaeon]|nr:hypothetical protein [Nitrososphaerota archaeon]
MGVKGERSAWRPMEIEMDSLDLQGRNIVHLQGVPVLKNIRTGEFGVNPNDVMKVQLRILAEQENVEPRDISLLALLRASVGSFQVNCLHNRYRLNKMLFYQWKELEKIGLGEAYDHDVFQAKSKGPVPIHLDEDIRRLQEKGLVKVTIDQWGKKSYQGSKDTELTPKGKKIAQEILSRLPEDFIQITAEVKKKLYNLDPSSIKDKVHREYPEYRTGYTEEDNE